MTVKDYYDTYWSADGLGRGGGTHASLVRLFESAIDETSRCLDFGCGDGRTSGLWVREHAGSYVGVDVSRGAVDQARALGLEAHPIESEAALPFPDDSFDVALCIEVLEHLFHPHLAAAEILRVLRPGGVLVATVPNLAYWRRRLDLALLGRWNPLGDGLSVEQPWRDPHIRFFNVVGLRRMLTAAGFEGPKVGGHDGGVLSEIPGARRISGPRGSSWPYRRLEAAFPSLLGRRLHAFATRPDPSRRPQG